MSKQGRAQSQLMREEREAAKLRAARRDKAVKWGGGLVVLGLLIAIGFAVASAMAANKATVRPDAPTEAIAPASATDEGAIVQGSPDAPVKVEVYYDYMCPSCGIFESTNSEALTDLVEQDRVQLLLKPISFLDATSQGTRYSTRAANAFATVADQEPELAWDFHKALYENQPSEGTEGLSDKEIGDLALEVGVSPAVVKDFEKGTHEAWIKKRTDKSFDEEGVNGTPTVRINGEDLEAWSTSGALEDAVDRVSP